MSTPHRRSDAPARARHRAALATICAALLLVVVTTGYAEARGAPRWLSRLFRTVSGRADVAAPAAPSDTVVLFGPKVLSLGSATSATFVERFTVNGLPTSTLVAPPSGYLLRATNGPNGSGAVTGGSITLNGSVVVTGTQLAALGAGSSLDVPVQIAPSDTLLAALTGPGGSAVSVSVLAAPDPTFIVFGPKQYERDNGTPVTVTERFTVPQGGIAPSYLCVQNGELDGTRRNSSATVVLNGVTVVTQAELNQQVAGFRKKVTFLPAGQENVLQVQLQGSPGSRLTLCAAATDAAPPTITVTAPAKGLITSKTDVDAVGVVNDQTAVTVTVNGQPATVAAGTADNTSFSAKVPLATEGSNTITIHAVDAAGNATDSVRTVIRDTQAPVVTLDALPDSALYKKDSVLTITGTITDATAVTANVNGVALAVDTATHAFSQQVSLAQGTNFISITATDAAGNATSVVRQVTLDNVPPTLTLTGPATGLVTKTPTVQVTGRAVAQSAVLVTVNDVNAPVGANGAFTANVALTEGSNTIRVVASNAAGVTAMATRTVILDTQPPAIAWSAPTDASTTKQNIIDVDGSITDRTPVTVRLNGASVAVTQIDQLTSSFSSIQPLTDDGVATLTLVATDAAGNTTTLQRTITKDATPPVITVQNPVVGATTTATSMAVDGSVADLTTATLTINGIATPVANDGGFSTTVQLATGANVITLTATDAAGNQTTVTRSVTRDAPSDVAIPPDPATVAPALNRTVATNIASSTSFLFSGASPIQTGVAAGTMQPYQQSVVRGRVLTREGAALSGATVSVLGHPELGKTVSRADGAYDLAVNGGGDLTIVFTKTGQLTAHRRVAVPRQRWVHVDDVALVALDPVVTPINLSDPSPVARGSVVTDASGSRQTTLVFEQGTEASMVLADGSTQPLTSLSVRATEYTVGEGGLRAMPASLPSTSAYTYAAELSVDEAMAAGARSVTFTKPVSVYLENFIGFPVGITIPVATYDRQRSLWIPEQNGRVIKVVATTGGVAQLDLNGNGVASSDSLAALGFTSAELGRIAELYSPGQTVWRFRLKHFTPVDGNLSAVQKSQMIPMYELPEPMPLFAPTPQTDDAQGGGKQPDKPSCETGSIIGCESRSLGETVPITGTGAHLIYSSEHTPGYRADYEFDVSLGKSISDDLLASMKSIVLRVSVAGKTTIDTFPASRGQRAHVQWDGRDAYGRLVQGQARMTIEVGYVYTSIPYGLPITTGPSFGQSSGAPMQQTVRAPITLWQTMLDRNIGSWNNAATGLGGWTLPMHHAYDPTSGVLYFGSGGKRSATNMNPSLLGTGAIRSPSDFIFNPDGSVLVLDSWTGRIYKVARDGSQTVFAGSGSFQSSGNGGLAVNAGMNPAFMARTPDGNVFVEDFGSNQIRKIDTAGVITAYAGSGDCSGTRNGGDGGPALLAQLCSFGTLAAGPDGSLYVISYKSGSEGGRVRRIGPDGIITQFAGQDANECDFGGTELCQENVPAVSANIGFPRYLDVLPDGSVVIADINSGYVWKVSPGGLLTKLAGKTVNRIPNGVDGDGGPALLAGLGNMSGIAAGPDGSVYLSASINGSIVRRVGPDGIITRVAGSGTRCSVPCPPLNTSALQTALPFFLGMAVSPDNVLYIGDGTQRTVMRMAKPLPGFDGNDLAIASEDGEELYRFDNSGRHLATIDLTSGAIRYAFGYDAAGLLRTVTDADGNVTAIDRAGDGTPRAIVSPHGQRTTLALDPKGFIASVRAPGGQTVEFTYDSLGLMTRRLDDSEDLGAEHRYSYTTLGLLVSDRNPDAVTKTLASTGGQVVLTTGSLQPTTYLTETLPTGGYRHTITYPDGTKQITIASADDTTRVTRPDGSVQTSVRAADARFGLQAPTTSTTLRLPSGLTSSLVSRRTIQLSNPNDPLTLVTQIDSTIQNGIASIRTYNASTRTVTFKSPEGRLSHATLDSLGRPVIQASDGLTTSTYRYNDDGHLDQLVDAGQSSSFTYDALGRLSNVTGPFGLFRKFTYDSAGRILTRADGEGTTTLGYDAGGRLTTFAPPGRAAHRFDYTSGGMLLAYRAPAVDAFGEMVDQYRYDANGLLRAVVRPTLDSLTLALDASGRLASESIAEEVRTFNYSPQTGLITSASNGSSGYTLSYDGGLPVSTTLTAGAITGTVTYGRDAFLRPNSIGVNGDITTMTYDRDGLLLSTGALSIGRDATTGLESSTTLDGITSATTRDSTGASVHTTVAANGTVLYDVQLTRDELNRVTRRTETIAGQTVDLQFAYDSVGRLSTVTRDGAPYSTYTYDQNGNRIRRVAGAGVEQGVFDEQDRLVSYGSSSYRYTRAGALQYRITGTDTTEYHYDALSLLRWVRLPNGTRIDYLLDPIGRRIGRRVNGALVQGFLYQSDLQIAAELAADGSVRSRFVYGTSDNVPEYMVRNGVRYRIIADRLGSVRLVLDASSDTVVQRIDYDEYGRVTQNTNPGFQPFGYAGGLVDDMTGLVRLGARDYDPITGRFTSKDPLRFTAGDANLYRYVGDDPINRIDPRGKSGELLLAGVVIGGIVGAFEGLTAPCDGWRKFGGGLASGFYTGLGAEIVEDLEVGVAGTVALSAGVGVLSNLVNHAVTGEKSVRGEYVIAGLSNAVFGGLASQLAKGSKLLEETSEFLKEAAFDAADEAYKDLMTRRAKMKQESDDCCGQK